MGNLIAKIFVDPESLPNDAGGFITLLFHLFVYGYILSKSSQLISDGSELLLLIPALAGIVGSVVLPVLGAVPDGAIVLFSGLGDDAQEQLSVGVGALAGSTIMLLTIPWALCILQGRVDVRNGEAQYKGKPKLSAENKWTLFKSGITPKNSMAINGRIMIVTAISYVFIQMPAFGLACGEKSSPDCNGISERKWAIVSLVLSVVFFVGYLVYNVKFASEEDKEELINQVRQTAIEQHIVSLSTAFETLMSKEAFTSAGSEKEREEHFDNTLRRFFKKYDINGDNKIDQYELRFLFKDFNEKIADSEFNDILKRMDADGSGSIDYKEFKAAMKEFVQKRHVEETKRHSATLQPERSVSMVPLVEQPPMEGVSVSHPEGREAEKDEEEEKESEEEEDAEIPEDLADLPPEKQRTRVLLRSAWMMGVGTLIVLLFSDPMVDVLSELGNRIHVPPFYVAFILAPIASNASELIASIQYATKKTKNTISISIGALEGAACMNNTFCLALFLILIVAKQLVWEFSAETLSILFVEIGVFGLTFKKTHTLFHAIILLSFYPLSLILVGLLEGPGHLN